LKRLNRNRFPSQKEIDMKKNIKRFKKSVSASPLLLLLLLICNVIIGQEQRQARSILFTNSACGNYPEKGNFLESGATLNAGGNGCITTIKSGSGLVLFKGHDKIILGPGFHTETGAKFIAFIETDSAIESAIQEQAAEINAKNIFSTPGAKLIPGKVFIGQNSPNPFRENTVISYAVPAKFYSAQIVIHDGIGRLRKQINVPAQGSGTLNLNGAEFGSGIYSYSLWVDGQIIATRKMVLIR